MSKDFPRLRMFLALAVFLLIKPDPNFSESQLTEVERRNISTIAAYEKKALSAMSVIEG